MNILILTGKFGMGHWSASQSLRLQLLNAFPAANVTVEDFLPTPCPTPPRPSTRVSPCW